MLAFSQIDTIDDFNEIHYTIWDRFKKFTTIDITNAVISKFAPLVDFKDISEK